MKLKTATIFEVRLTPTEAENFSEIIQFAQNVPKAVDLSVFEPDEAEYDLMGFMFTHERLNAFITALENLSTVQGAIPQPKGLLFFLASLKEIAFGHDLFQSTKTVKNMATQALISA